MVPEPPTTTKVLFLKVTPCKVESTDVLEVHEVPSEEVWMVLGLPGEIPTDTKVLPP